MMGEIFRKEFTISLDDPESIQKAIDAIQKIADGLPKAMDALCNKLVTKGVEIARKNVDRLCKTQSGALYNSIRFELSDGGKGIAYVVAGYPFDHYSENPKYENVSYAVFVEFGYGTGSYYDTTDTLVTEQRRIDRRKTSGKEEDKPRYGRSDDHPSGNGRYRDAETYGIIKNQETGDYAFGWKYQDRRTGKWHTSYGQNPKPFMYNTLMELSQIAAQEGGGKLALYLSGSL